MQQNILSETDRRSFYQEVSYFILLASGVGTECSKAENTKLRRSILPPFSSLTVIIIMTESSKLEKKKYQVANSLHLHPVIFLVMPKCGKV
jgi:DNA polymerase III delta subunit